MEIKSQAQSSLMEQTGAPLKEIRALVKSAMKAQGLSQTDVAKAANVSKQAVSRLFTLDIKTSNSFSILKALGLIKNKKGGFKVTDDKEKWYRDQINRLQAIIDDLKAKIEQLEKSNLLNSLMDTKDILKDSEKNGKEGE